MRNAKYFLNYKTGENIVTNNTMLLLSRIYNNSPKQFYKILYNLEIIDPNIDLIPTFINQVADLKNEAHSIPDAIISQNPFNIVIETKKGDNFSEDQLINHIKYCISNKTHNNNYLVALGKFRISESIENKVNYYINNNVDTKGKVKFTSLSFKELISIIKDNISKSDDEMNDIVNEYEEYCTEQELLPNDYRMLIRTAGVTIDDDVNYRVYWDSPTASEYFTYMGLYRNKKVEYIGKKIDTIHYINGKPNKSPSEEQYGIIQTLIAKNNWDENSLNLTVFFFDKFEKTDFKKGSNGGLFSRKYINLNDYINDVSQLSTEKIAEYLKSNNIEWGNKGKD